MLRFFVFTLVVAGALAQAPCKCGGFVSTDEGEIMLYELPPIDMTDCTHDNQCSKRCYDEFAALSGGGDLNAITSDGVTTVGQLLCTAAGTPIDNQFVYAYYNLCDTNWQWTGDTTLQPLCCDDSGAYFEC